MSGLKDGVYISKRTGKLKVLDMTGLKWVLDEGIIKQHPLFRLKVPVVAEMTPGWPLDETNLKNCEYLGEL
jgi:hypothetical protein